MGESSNLLGPGHSLTPDDLSASEPFARAARRQHDPLCDGLARDTYRACACDVIAEVRADERKREALRGPSVAWYDAHARLVLADLRTQVEDLFVLSLFSGDYVNRAEVLALFDGGSE